MGRGVIPAGSKKFVELDWHDNPMPSLYNDDAIHVFQIRMSEELRVLDLAKVNDPTLNRLLNMGCFDWKAPNSVTLGTRAQIPTGYMVKTLRSQSTFDSNMPSDQMLSTF